MGTKIIIKYQIVQDGHVLKSTCHNRFEKEIELVAGVTPENLDYNISQILHFFPNQLDAELRASNLVSFSKNSRCFLSGLENEKDGTTFCKHH